MTVNTNMDQINKPKQIVRHLRLQHRGALQMVVAYNEDTYRVLYDAEDVDSEASSDVHVDREMECIYDDLILEEVEKPFQEQIFTDQGSIEGKIRIFENKTVAHFWPTEDKDGLFVSFNADADPGVRSLLSVAQAYYN